jgi:hypothetical protein
MAPSGMPSPECTIPRASTTVANTSEVAIVTRTFQIGVVGEESAISASVIVSLSESVIDKRRDALAGNQDSSYKKHSGESNALCQRTQAGEEESCLETQLSGQEVEGYSDSDGEQHRNVRCGRAASINQSLTHLRDPLQTVGPEENPG